MSLNTTPRTWVSGEVVTATEMNTEIRDALTGLQAAWTSYTPSATGFTVGNGSLTGHYLQIGKTFLWSVDFTAGSTSSFSGSMMVTAPATLNARYAAGFIVGSGVASSNGSAPWLPLNCDISSGIRLLSGVTGAASSTTVPVTWGTTSQFHISGVFEGA